LPEQNGTITAAEFTVNGETDFTFDIALPAGSFDVNTVAELQQCPEHLLAPNATGTLTLGTETLLVGATIWMEIRHLVLILMKLILL
jgi:hypothetical protein